MTTFMSIVASQALAFLAPEVLSSRGSALAAWALGVLFIFAAAWRRSGSVSAIKGDVEASAIGLVFTLVGLAIAVFQPFETWSRLTIAGTDFNRHLVFIRGLVESGGLNYRFDDYPRGLHSLVAWAWTSSGGESYADAWRALESTMWLLVVLVAVSVTVITVRVLRMLGVPGGLFAWAAALIVALGLSQSVVVTAMFRIGFVTSIFATLILLAIWSIGTERGGAWLGTPWSLGWLATAVCVMAHAWVIMVPVLAAVSALGLWLAFRDFRSQRTSPREWIGPLSLVVAACVVTIPALMGLLTGVGVGEGLATAGYSGMLDPESWWYFLVALAVGSALMLWRGRTRRYSAMLGIYLALGGALVAFVASAGPGPGEELNYYASKTLWTLSVLVPPLAAATGAWVVARLLSASRRMRSGLLRTTTFALTLSIVAVTSVAIAGRMSGSPSHTMLVLRGETNIVPLALPTVTELERRGIQSSGEDAMPGVLVWGILPAMSAVDLDTPRPGVQDWVTRESTAWLGLVNLDGSPLYAAAILRDTAIACDYLRANPEAVRITGPNPAAGAGWLIDSGCPVDVVRPDEWVSVPIDPAWYKGTWLEERDPDAYPTHDEFQAYLAEQEALRNQQAPAPSQS